MSRIWGPLGPDPKPKATKHNDKKNPHAPKVTARPVKGQKPKHAKKKGSE